MASHTLRANDRFPAAQNVSVYPASAKRLGAAPSGSSVAGPVAVAADGSVTFAGLADGTFYTAYASVSGVDTYVDFTTDTPRIGAPGGGGDKYENLEDARRRLWLPGSAVTETIRRHDATGTVTAPASGTLYLAGGAVLPRKKTVSKIAFISGSQAAAAPTRQWFCIVRQSDLAVLAKTADDTNVAWAANAAKELTLSSPYTSDEDIAIYLGLLVAAGTVPNLLGAVMANAVLASVIATPTLAATSTAGLTDPASLGAVAGALTGVAGCAYATLR